MAWSSAKYGLISELESWSSVKIIERQKKQGGKGRMIISLEERNVRSEQISIHIDNIKYLTTGSSADLVK